MMASYNNNIHMHRVASSSLLLLLKMHKGQGKIELMNHSWMVPFNGSTQTEQYWDTEWKMLGKLPSRNVHFDENKKNY
jgi:hypothetical protein